MSEDPLAAPLYRARTGGAKPARVNDLTQRTVAFVLAGGRGTRLKQLTDRRAKPAVPFAGKLKIIDFALSNCVNSGIRRIAVLTQYKAQSLIRHVERGWGFLAADLGEYVDVAPAQQRLGETWYSGTADAVLQNLNLLHEADADYVLVLAGDHVYKMDYSVMLAEHVASGADVTVACVDVPLADAVNFGVMAVDAEGRVVDFQEKPAQPTPMPGKDGRALASMGIYVFGTKFLSGELERDAREAASSHDFGKDVIPGLVRRGSPDHGPPLCRQLRQHGGRSAVLARCRDDRRVLGGQHRPDPCRTGAQSLRRPLADPQPATPTAPGEVRVRRGHAAWNRPGFAGVRRLHRQWSGRPTLDPLCQGANRRRQPRGGFGGVAECDHRTRVSCSSARSWTSGACCPTDSRPACLPRRTGHVSTSPNAASF